jgi:superfamily I DNA/RNA helicase
LVVGPNGEKIQYSAVSTSDDLENTILKIIRHYVFVEGFEYSDIVVLFGDRGKNAFKKAINNKQNSLGVSFRSLRSTYDSYTHKTGIIVADSVYSYRGLENKVVILTGIDGVLEEEDLNICYVGASRARNILHIVATPETIESIQNLF